MDLKIITLGEIRQSCKDKYLILSLTSSVYTKKKKEKEMKAKSELFKNKKGSSRMEEGDNTE
jgi:hypothetical protein